MTTRLVSFTLYLLFGALFMQLQADDAVIVKTASDATVTRRGTVVDVNGAEVLLRDGGDRVDKIPLERVLDIQSSWTASETKGDSAFQRGAVADAIAAYKLAKTEEARPWAVRKIQRKLVECYQWHDQPLQASEEFLSFAAEAATDSPDFAVIPLPWQFSAAADEALQPLALRWITAKQSPNAQLLGAAWLLGTKDRPRALDTLRELASGIDRDIALLATAQTWRVEMITASAEEVGQWPAKLERLRPNLTGGPLLVMGETWQRHKQVDAALLCYLEVGLMATNSSPLGAKGLLAAAKLMEKEPRRQADALAVYRRCWDRYPQLRAKENLELKVRTLSTTQVKP